MWTRLLASFVGGSVALTSFAFGYAAATPRPVSPIVEHSGCCSRHKGVCGCSGRHAECCDGTQSPTCGCD
jgi:hypothetical protein